MNVKELIDLLSLLPDDALVGVYEGESIGIVVKDKHNEVEWFLDTSTKEKNEP